MAFFKFHKAFRQAKKRLSLQIAMQFLGLLSFAIAMGVVEGVYVAQIGIAPDINSLDKILGPPPSESFPYHDQLTKDYTLYWNSNSTHIKLEMVVKTNGWVGFGISPKGAMKSSDVIIGWVKDGQVHFADRHAEGNFLPAKDLRQDWSLISGQETGQYTTLKVVRKLDTCDDQDMPVKVGTTRIIYAYGASDPTSDYAISYHGSTRGTKSLALLEPAESTKQKVKLPADVKTLEFTNRNFPVPSANTTYSCTTWKIPDLGEKHHVIKYEPIIQKGHETLVHHINLYYCEGKMNDKEPDAFTCYQGSLIEAHGCTHLFIAWTIGAKVFNYPSNVGFSLGGPGDPGYFLMETHYDNHNERNDYVDDSGLRLYLTRQLRKYDGGVMIVGVLIGPYQIIPPRESSFISTGLCDSSCFGESLGDKEIHVFANLLHAHRLAVKLRTRHFRNGTELPPIQEDTNYDFNYQETKMLEREIIIKKGDTLVVECEYDSSHRSQVSYGGYSSYQEMCLSGIVYYPKIQLTECTSRVLYKFPAEYAGRSPMDITQQLDWSNPKTHETFRRVLEVSPHAQFCHGSQGELKTNWQTVYVPKTDNPYQSPNMCPA
ncbi:hypothetical protein RRG08_042044 [Elysia crispata]|uniref:DOMON domain-containing protein n=1 Tax=Elysia crispata TaxID=231223 RepID=A0AAE0Z8C6_9GAST|nr:hypothetical protein RRG08_042044 [Elysia crispata]